jgi:hypothetical protein
MIGVVSYAAANFYGYETLRGMYRHTSRRNRCPVGNDLMVLIGSAVGAIVSMATFPLEVAPKQMQVGSSGRWQVYKNDMHTMYYILKKLAPEGCTMASAFVASSSCPPPISPSCAMRPARIYLSMTKKTVPELRMRRMPPKLKPALALTLTPLGNAGANPSSQPPPPLSPASVKAVAGL